MSIQRCCPLALAACALFLAPARRVQATTLSIDPTFKSVSVGQQFSLDVRIGQVTDLYAFQFDVGVNPQILSIQSVIEGPFLAGGGSTFFLSGTYDSGLGLLSGVTDSLVGAGSGVDGGGVLATITFLAVDAGVSPISLDMVNTILLNSSIYQIQVDQFSGGQVTVTPVAEPSTLSMIGLALVALARRRLHPRAGSQPSSGVEP